MSTLRSAAACAIPGTPLAGERAGIDACVHCGFCLQACPTYLTLEDENDSPRGRIVLMRALLEGTLPPESESVHRHIAQCLGCRACETACPSGVPYGHLLEAARGQLVRRGVSAPASDHATLAFVLAWLTRPRRLAPLLHALRLYQRSGLQRLVRGSGLLAR